VWRRSHQSSRGKFASTSWLVIPICSVEAIIFSLCILHLPSDHIRDELILFTKKLTCSGSAGLHYFVLFSVHQIVQPTDADKTADLALYPKSVGTTGLDNDSDRNLDLKTIWFLDLHCILQYNFWIGFEFEKINLLYLEKT